MTPTRLLIAALLTWLPLAAPAASFVTQQAADTFGKAADNGTRLGPAIAAIDQARHQAQKAHFARLGVELAQINRPWEILLQAFAQKLALPETAHIQFVVAPQVADWTDKTYGAYRRALYGDTMAQWGPTFNAANGSSFAALYGTFINSIAMQLGSPQDQANAEAARMKWSNCNTALQNQRKLVGAHWADFDTSQSGLPSGQRINFQTWYRDYEAPALGTYQQKCNALAITYNVWLNKATAHQATLANAIMRYSSTGQQLNVLVPGTTDQFTAVWPYAFVQSLDDFVHATDSTHALAFDQTFNKSSGTYTATTSHWGGSASYGWFFHANAGGSSSTVDTHSDAFSMKLQIKGLQVFDVQPVGWFSPELVQLYRHGPFQPNSPIKQYDDNGQLYGPNGVFSLRSARFIVAYKPYVKLTMSANDYRTAKRTWETSSGLGIGPFAFGASAGGSRTDISWDDSSNTLIAQDATPVPKVVAVVLDTLPDFQ